MTKNPGADMKEPSTFEIERDAEAEDAIKDLYHISNHGGGETVYRATDREKIAHKSGFILGADWSRDYFRSKPQDQAEVIGKQEAEILDLKNKNHHQFQEFSKDRDNALDHQREKHRAYEKISHLEKCLSDTEKMLEIAENSMNDSIRASEIREQDWDLILPNAIAQIAKMRAGERPRCKHGVCETDRCFECYPNIGLKEGEE